MICLLAIFLGCIATYGVVAFIKEIIKCFAERRRLTSDYSKLKGKLAEVALERNELRETCKALQEKMHEAELAQQRGTNASMWALQCEVDQLKDALRKKETVLKNYARQVERKA